jgi:acetoin utilization deacetylase AcuC-like enzyme
MNPEILLISAGYDAHKEDPFRMLCFCDDTYHWFGSRLAALAEEICNGRLVFVLEGGYNVDAIGRSVVQTMKGVLGMAGVSGEDQLPIQEGEEQRLKEVEKIVSDLKRIHNL